MSRRNAQGRLGRLLVLAVLVSVASALFLTSGWRGPTGWILDHANKLGGVCIIAAVGIAYYHASMIRKFDLRSKLQTPFAFLGPLIDPFFNGITYGGLILASLRSLNVIADHGTELALPPFDRAAMMVLLLAVMAWSVFRSVLMVVEAWKHSEASA